MLDRLIKLEAIIQNSQYLGTKAINLAKCLELGFNVPDFFAIPSDLINELYSNGMMRQKISSYAASSLRCSKFVVRSSALVEDGEHESFAGQFSTILDISAEEINDAIYKIIEQAKTVIDISHKFSIIIQEYIEADISGVAFSRNPDGNREMVLEYENGAGEKIVSGKIQPKRILSYWEEADLKLPSFLKKIKISEAIKTLEKTFGKPQDIEWCIKNDKLYILQTRCVTTINDRQYEQIKFLETELKGKKEFLFEKTEISEIAPRPSAATFDLLQQIYSSCGPIAKTYEKYGIKYSDTSFLKILGNELFVDKDKEIQSLLPSFSSISRNNYIPKITRLSGIITTLNNFLYLNKIKTCNYDKLFLNLSDRLSSTLSAKDVNEALDIFLSDYELIFEINLLAGLSQKKLDLAIKKEPVNYVDLAKDSALFVNFKNYNIYPPKNLSGNSIDLLDDTNFIAVNIKDSEAENKIKIWWNKLPKYKKKFLKNKIQETMIYNKLREYGRWLAIKNINTLRSHCLQIANDLKFKNPTDIFFSGLNHIIKKSPEEASCLLYKNKYVEFNKYSLPVKIASSFYENEKILLGLSAGEAEGILIAKDNFESNRSENNQIILFVEFLTPDLTRYFENISGIITGTGGLLSHLAIIAREKGIPVVSNFKFDKNIKKGDLIKIDGSNGTIEKIMK